MKSTLSFNITSNLFQERDVSESAELISCVQEKCEWTRTTDYYFANTLTILHFLNKIKKTIKLILCLFSAIVHVSYDFRGFSC